MNKQIIIIRLIVFFSLFCTIKLHAQEGCTFKAPFFTMDFGSGKDIPDPNYFSLQMYKRAFSTCPIDGNYSYVTNTSDCFNGDWLTFDEDHTPNDNAGRMMLVNASETGGIFFNFVINGLKGNTTYQLAAWLVNVCRISGGCSPLPPDIIIKIRTLAGTELAVFRTGLLSQNVKPFWKKYEGIFTTTANVNAVLLTMEDVTLGGCGNDFAMDDITLQECIKPTPVEPEVKSLVTKAEVKKEVIPVKKEEKKPSAITKQEPKKTRVIPPVKKDTAVTITKKPTPDKPENMPTTIKEKPVVAIPKLILTRENPVIKKIETAAGEIIINLYDNGEIDGDTVTIYHNNKLIVARAGLSEKAITFHIMVDAMHPHHELVMVADNLGSIPPNTSLMVVMANNKRYEIFISSSEQKNAKIVINLEK
ncbi:MAG: hypothetical protein ACR2KX_16735 [Chitinophagaceae bacterium]